ncbi:hypothetical protein ACKS0A_12020 [Histoplasma ohiense]
MKIRSRMPPECSGELIWEARHCDLTLGKILGHTFREPRCSAMPYPSSKPYKSSIGLRSWRQMDREHSGGLDYIWSIYN